MQVEIDGSRKDCFELVTTKDASEVEDHKIEVVGPEIDEIPVGSKISMSYTVEVAGKAMQPDFEPVFERKIHSFLNCVEGLMHTGQRDMIRVRISKADFEAGFKFKHIGEVLYAKIKSEFDTVVDKCQVRIVVGDEPNAELRKHANEVFDKRDERLKSMTDESVPVFYSCIMCQAFSPSHVCIVTPERLGLCGAVSWLDAKATNELDPQGPLPGRHQGALHRRAHRPLRRRRRGCRAVLARRAGARHAVLPARGSDDLLRLLRVHLRHRAVLDGRRHYLP